MKKILFALTLFATAFTMSCQGPAGPEGLEGLPGPRGPQGEPGVNILGTVFDITGTFNTGNDYRIYFEFPADEVEVFESDAVFVYRLWETIEDGNEDIPVWRLLPQTTFLPQGALQYNFDHTFLDVSVFIDTQFNRTTLEPRWTNNQTFRVVIIPADFAANGRLGKEVDFTNYEEVQELLQLNDRSIKKYSTKN
ncbi:collagen-like triple helix repeat-containing protein [Arundinibacter roseus]|uniref:Collagen-like protein n=1 Tax=Arundinibacter roseus TaxID=2070510 RepID=A0A4R4KJ72_9BACT|nr:collagen-like protein [Arundinibacter roseus]TDB66912.1 collagen-like protein [Arundinibacter roseus]